MKLSDKIMIATFSLLLTLIGMVFLPYILLLAAGIILMLVLVGFFLLLMHMVGDGITAFGRLFRK